MATYEEHCKRRGIPYTLPPKPEPARSCEPGGQILPDAKEVVDPPKKVKKPAAKKKKPAPKKKK